MSCSSHTRSREGLLIVQRTVSALQIFQYCQLIGFSIITKLILKCAREIFRGFEPCYSDSIIYITPSEEFLQRVSIACYAERCISYRKSVCLSVRLSVCLSVTVWHCVKTTQARIMGSSPEDSTMTLVSSCLTAARNSKGNLGSEAAE